MDASIENKLLQEQLLQEAFLDSVKAYAQEKYNKIVSTISDWKDAAAIIGNVFGYWFGKKVGENLYIRKDSFLFKKQHLITTKAFYDKHGGTALILGRFLPIIRTFAPILAGVIQIDFKTFMMYNIIGAFAWIGSIASIAYFLGKQFPAIENYIGYIVIGLIVITTIPVLITYLRSRKKS